jgi:hypothetical protein
MKTRHILFLILAVSLSFSSCSKSNRKSLLPTITGKAGEVVVVIEKDYWTGLAGDTLRHILRTEVPGLPQSEPLFDVVQIPHDAFSDLFQKHRNIILCKIGPKFSPKFELGYDQWAKPQILIQISAPDQQSFIDLVNQNSDNIIGLLSKAERERLVDNYTNYQDKEVEEKIKNFYPIDLVIPKGYQFDMDTNNFAWISHETPEISQGIFIYYYDYTDTATFTKDFLVKKRNEMLQLYVAGPRDGSYMTTEDQVDVIFRSYKLNNQYTAELRGLWKVAGDYMGGPFVSLTQFDKKHNKIVTVEGYVYAPKYDKRNYTRQLEAIIQTMKLTD